MEIKTRDFTKSAIHRMKAGIINMEGDNLENHYRFSD